MGKDSWFAFARTGINSTLRIIINAGTKPVCYPITQGEKILMASGADGGEKTIEEKGYRITLEDK